MAKMTNAENNISGPEMEFLLKEYSECYNQMRHYDILRINYIKFVFTLYVAILSASYAIYKIGPLNQLSGLVISILLMIGFVGGMFFLSLLVRNRVYFVSVSRQVNIIRNYSIDELESPFKEFNNLNFKNDNPQHYNFHSTHVILILVLIIFNTLFISLAMFFLLLMYANSIPVSPRIAYLAGGSISAGIGILQYQIAESYLKSRDSKKAHEAIHET